MRLKGEQSLLLCSTSELQQRQTFQAFCEATNGTDTKQATAPPCQVVFPLSEVKSFPNMHNFKGGSKQSAKCAVSWTVIWRISCVKLRSFKTYSFLSQTMPSTRQTPGLLARREPRKLAKRQQLPRHLVSASPRAIGRASSASPRP